VQWDQGTAPGPAESTTDALFTIGHSTRPIGEFVAILESAGVSLLVDVRTIPRSRRYPQFEGGALADTLSDHGIAYWHERGLGGFRQPRPRSPNDGWRHPSFRGYADHMSSDEFLESLDRLETMALEETTSIMCAEADASHCHRRLIADALALRGWQVIHLGKGEPSEHQVTPIAVLGRDGRLTYPPLQGELAL
jgi:uncharacterized protein (DUF488 family)